MAAFSEQLHSVEAQLSRLASLLEEQAASRRRRRLLTIRFFMGLTLVAALLSAWMAGVYRESRLQAHAVDQLIKQGVFVLYEPRESFLVSLMPGEAESPPKTLERTLGTDFFRSVNNVSTRGGTLLQEKQNVLDAVEKLTDIKYLRLTGLQWKTTELEPLSRLDELQSLDLTRTRLDAGPMPWLRRSKLRWIDLSHTRFSDLGLYDLSFCDTLQYANLERSAVTDEGIAHLGSLSQLRYLNLRRCPVTLPAVQKLSKTLPHCVIDWEPLVFRPDGSIDERAVRMGRQRLGTAVPPDPRESHRAQAPLDRAPDRRTPSRATGWPYVR